MLTIGYKKKHLYFDLTLGAVWLFFGISYFWNSEKLNFLYYGYFLLSFSYLMIFYFKSRFKYITVTQDIIKFNQPFGWKVNCSDIISIRRFAGDYIIKTNIKDYTISGKLIDPKMAVPLEEYLKKMSLPWA